MINNSTEEERAWWDGELRRHNRIIAKGYWGRLRAMIGWGAVAIMVIFIFQGIREVAWAPPKVVIPAMDTAAFMDSVIRNRATITSDTPSAEIQKVYDSTIKDEYDGIGDYGSVSGDSNDPRFREIKSFMTRKFELKKGAVVRIYLDTAVIGKAVPCEIDTLKGILIWHSGDVGDDGNSWDYGYWIGKRGPLGYMPLEKLSFVPGVYKRTYQMSENGASFKTYESEEVNDGFRDAKFRSISGDQVYGFIILNKGRGAQ